MMSRSGYSLLRNLENLVPNTQDIAILARKLLPYKCAFNVKYGDKVTTLPLAVVKGERPSLLGRNWRN